jgi:hypothetical protein
MNRVVSVLSTTTSTIIDLAKVGTQLTIRADTSGMVGSVSFGFDRNRAVMTENNTPFSLGGNYVNHSAELSYYAVPQLNQMGTHSVSATPFFGNDLGGAMGRTAMATVTIVDSSSSTGPSS